MQSGAQMSGPGFDARFTAGAADFLRAMVVEASRLVFAADESTPVVSHFKGVYRTDGSRLDLSEGGLKVVARLELQQGGLQIGLEELNCHDNASAVMDEPLPAGALHLADLGFFDLERFEQWASQGVEWLTRYKAGVQLFDRSGQPLNLTEILAGTQQPVTQQVLVGHRQVPMTLLAERVSEACYRKRCAQLHHRARRKNEPVSQERLKLAHWTLYLTSCTGLTVKQAHTLYRSRWQIERCSNAGSRWPS